MKILHCSDWHADWLTSGVSRFDDVQDAVRQTVDAAIEAKVSLYLMTGDLCDPDDCPRALRAVGLALWAASTLARAGVPSWWVKGNHCVVEDGSGRSTLTPLSMLGDPMIRVFDQPARTMLPGRPSAGRGVPAPAHAILLPYPAASAPYDPAEFVRHHRGALSAASQVVVAGHLQVEGATPGDETTEMGKGRDVFFPFEECEPLWLLLGGHYHDGQAFERAGRRLHVPGSLVRLNHGEERNRPRFLIWEV